MNQNVSFIRKVVYVACIALLLFPLFYLGQPATHQSSGGLLAQMRTENGLTQAGLGDVDPASETMKLSTLGLRPVAVALLWNDANRYKMKEDWDQFSATVKQIVRLQPNFIKVWDFQAHNISYNVSVEFDNYKHRYHWVKKGFDFLTEGTHYNRDNPLLLQRLGWFFGQKIGRSDEQRQFRRLFRADSDFHDRIKVDLPELERHDADGPDGRPDNWLVGRLWNLRAQDAVDLKGKTLVGSSPLIFYSYVPMMRINFAKAIEEEGYLEEYAEITWQKAGDEWQKFGEKDIPSSWGHNVRLGAAKRLRQESEELEAKLDELVPGARAAIREERLAQQPPAIRAVIEKPADQRTPNDWEVVSLAEKQMKAHPRDIAVRAPADVREHAKRLAAQAAEADRMAIRSHNYAETVRYSYWATRCEVEQKRETVNARKHQFLAAEHLQKAELEDARKEYEMAWELWGGIIDKYPDLIEDITGDELYESIEKYEKVLGQLDKTFPENFKLKQIRDYNLAKKAGKRPELPKPVTSDDKKDAPPKSEAKEPEKTKPEESKPEDKKPEDSKPEEKKPDDKKPDDKKPDDKKPDDKKPEDSKPIDSKPDDKKPTDNKPEDKKPEDNKSEEKKPDDGKPSEAR